MRDFGLEVEIELTERRLGYLRELLVLRDGLVKHKPFNWKRHDAVKQFKGLDNIIEVICTCGEVIKYRVPLLTLSDFVCPKERITSGKVQQVQKFNDKGSGRARLSVKSKRKERRNKV